jgi:endonuclease III
MVNSLPEKQKFAKSTIKKLRQVYPGAHCALYHHSPFQLLIATILSAQCTDERVNKVTPPLFKKFPDVKDFASAKIKDLENLVRSTGFYKNKAKNIKACAQTLMKNHDSQVPKTMNELVSLPGVGRKTANVLLGNAYGIPGVVVDTHVGRLSRRMGFTKQKNPEIIERELETIFQKKDWIDLSHLLIFHGRALCDARKPKCDDCFLNKQCLKVGI